MTSLALEFVSLHLGDKRLHRRCRSVVEHLQCHPGRSFPKLSERWGWVKGLYRFFANPKVTREKLMEPHQKNTVKRCEEEAVVLAVQDTTVLDYSHHPHKEGLGLISEFERYQHGMLVHSVLAVGGHDKKPLGVLHQQVFVRQGKHPKEETSSQRLKRERESQKWFHGLSSVHALLPSHPKVIHVGDREADIYALIQSTLSTGQSFVIRCAQNRSTKEGLLFEELKRADVKGKTLILIPRNGSRKAREATMELRSTSVTLHAPRNAGQREQSLPVNVVIAKELTPPSGVDPLQWILLTAEPVDTFTECLTVLTYYQCRWMIEEFHKGLKTGCKIEERQLSTREQLEKLLAVFSVIVVHLLLLRFLASKTQDHDADLPVRRAQAGLGLTEIQQQILRTKFPKESQDFCAKNVLVLIARMGGFLGRKSDGAPGWLTLLRGMYDLYLMEQGAILAQTFMGKG